MIGVTERERRLALGFYAATALATAAWWYSLQWPDIRTAFLGQDFGARYSKVLLIGDIGAAMVLPLFTVFALINRSRIISALAWLHAGAQGYAWALSIVLAVLDPRAYWGLISMTFAAGTALAFALKLSSCDILWGAFSFKSSEEKTPMAYWNAALRQTAVMWGTFLLLIPLAIASVEVWLGWNANWWRTAWQLPLAIGLFVFGGSVGLTSGWVMTHQGEGTPLPSVGTRKLVVAGPYHYIRNPMAFGGILQGIAVGIGIGSALVVVYAILGGIWWEVLVRGLEEAYLAKKFGEPFERFRAQVPCWRFRLRAYRDS